MRAIQISRAGGPEVLQVVDLPEPKPEPGQVVVATTMIGVSFTDLFQRMLAGDSPVVPGVEAVGTVVATGEGVATSVPASASSHLIGLCDSGRIRPHIDKVFALEEAADAHRYLHDRRNAGKVLLRP